MPSEKSPTSSLGRWVPLVVAGTVLLLETLIGLSEMKRPLFIVTSVVAGVFTLLLALWYLKSREGLYAALAGGGFVLVLVLAWVAAPPSTTTATGNAPSLTPTQLPSFDGSSDEVIVEEPSESDALFQNAFDAPTPWFNEVSSLFPSATVEDPEGEAALSGTWWAMADWCTRHGHGSEVVVTIWLLSS